MKDYVILTERLGLRYITDNDFDELKTMLADRDVMYAWEKAFSDEEISAWIERRKQGYLADGFDYFLCEDLQSGETVGQIGLLKETLDGEVCYGVGWILKKDKQGCGYAAEGGRGVLDYAFRLLEIEEVVADIRPENKASVAVAERLGMIKTNSVVKIYDGKEMPHDVYRIKNPFRVHCTFRSCAKDGHYPAPALQQLQSMVDSDERLRATLAASGELFNRGYHPQMQSLHLKNSMQLESMIENYGFPTMDIAGKTATDNAWLILQHAISRPALMRAALAFFGTLNGYELPPASYAYLYDRVALYERRPQSYGTQFDYTLDGKFNCWWLENESSVDVRRGAVGLPPLADVRKRLLDEGAAPEIPVKDAIHRRLEQEKWLLDLGWCRRKDLLFCHETYGK